MKKLLVFVSIFMYQFSFGQWTTNGTNIYNTNSGNVGIGATSPDQKLTIKGGGIGFDGNSADKKLYSPSDGVLEWMTHDAASEHAFAISHQGTKRIYLNTSGNSYLTGGNVGIGTTSPLNGLHVFRFNDYSGGSIRFGHSGTNDAVMSFGWNPATSNDAFKLSYFPHNSTSSSVDLFTVGVDGNFGIGTTSPVAKLDLIKGNARLQFAPGGSEVGDVFRIFNANGQYFSACSYVPNSGNLITDLGVNYSIDGNNGIGSYARIGSKKAPMVRLNAEDGSIGLYGENGSGGDFRTPSHNLGLLVQNTGNIGIGTTDTKGYKLAVNGFAIFTKAVVKLYGNWPDYVFSPTYKLPSLKEVEEYIKQHRHLPDVASEEEVKKGGLDLGENQALLLKKIEELTLYVIEQQKQLEALKAQMKELKK